MPGLALDEPPIGNAVPAVCGLYDAQTPRVQR